MPPLDRNGFPPVSPEDQLWLKYLQDQVPEGHDMFARYPSVPLQYLCRYMHAEFRDLPRKDAADMTVKLLKECVLWRNAFGIDAISDSDLPRCLAFAPMCPMGVSGSDSDGHPIWVVDNKPVADKTGEGHDIVKTKANTEQGQARMRMTASHRVMSMRRGRSALNTVPTKYPEIEDVVSVGHANGRSTTAQINELHRRKSRQ